MMWVCPNMGNTFKIAVFMREHDENPLDFQGTGVPYFHTNPWGFDHDGEFNEKGPDGSWWENLDRKPWQTIPSNMDLLLISWTLLEKHATLWKYKIWVKSWINAWFHPCKKTVAGELVKKLGHSHHSHEQPMQNLISFDPMSPPFCYACPEGCLILPPRKHTMRCDADQTYWITIHILQ